MISELRREDQLSISESLKQWSYNVVSYSQCRIKLVKIKYNREKWREPANSKSIIAFIQCRTLALSPGG